MSVQLVLLIFLVSRKKISAKIDLLLINNERNKSKYLENILYDSI